MSSSYVVRVGDKVLRMEADSVMEVTTCLGMMTESANWSIRTEEFDEKLVDEKTLGLVVEANMYSMGTDLPF